MLNNCVPNNKVSTKCGYLYSLLNISVVFKNIYIKEDSSIRLDTVEKKYGKLGEHQTLGDFFQNLTI